MKLNHLTTTVVFVAAGMLLAVSCGHESKEKTQVTHADSVLFAAGRALDYTRLLELTDSFEHEGAITRMNANRWRGVGYNNLGKVRSAEYYYRKVVDAKIETDKDLYYYNKSVRRLAELLVRRGEYEEALRVAMPAIDRLRSSEDYSEKDMAILLNTIGCCQLNLGRLTEAAKNYESARQRLLELAAKDPSQRNLDDAIMAVDDIALSYIKTHHYSEAQKWTAVTDSLMAVRLQNVTEDRRKLVEEYRGRVALHRMLVLQGMGQQREAARIYTELADSDFGKSDEGLIGLATYLMEAGRMGEAADNFTHLDQLVQQRGLEPTLDNISTYLLPKYKANVGAGRIDSALAVGLKLCDMLDSVLVTSKSNDAAELATIYDTQQKENMIAEQQADMSRQRMRSILIVSLLVFAFLAIYIYHRIKAQRRLAHAYQQLELAHHKLEAVNTQLEMANAQLETANAQLEQKNEELTVANERAEESSRMKTNFIQQISHEIRTPLNILSGFTQVITMPDMELDDDTRQDINRQINENTNRITGLVNKMLELSDVNSRAVIECNDHVLAVQIAAQAAEDSGITTAEHLNFDMEMGEDGDTAMLQTNLAAATRVLTLVLDNARKFTKGAEALHHEEAAAADAGDKKSVVLRIAQDGQRVLFTVEDTGIGIPAEESEHIFDEFVQLNEYYDGTGIGLTVARSLARRLGGDVVLDTSYTGGARFVVTFNN